MSHPLVVNIHAGKRYDVYVGRQGHGKDGRWGNPYLLGRDGSRETVIGLYRKYLLANPALLRQLPVLKGKVLGCFCAPLPCHADVLAELANETHEGQELLFGRGE